MFTHLGKSRGLNMKSYTAALAHSYLGL